MAKKRGNNGKARPQHRYTEQDKANALDAVRRLGSINAAANALEIPGTTLRRWVRQSDGGELAEQKKPVRSLDELFDQGVEIAYQSGEKLLLYLSDDELLAGRESPAKIVNSMWGTAMDKIIKLKELEIRHQELLQANEPREFRLEIEVFDPGDEESEHGTVQH